MPDARIKASSCGRRAPQCDRRFVHGHRVGHFGLGTARGDRSRPRHRAQPAQTIAQCLRGDGATRSHVSECVHVCARCLQQHAASCVNEDSRHFPRVLLVMVAIASIPLAHCTTRSGGGCGEPRSGSSSSVDRSVPPVLLLIGDADPLRARFREGAGLRRRPLSFPREASRWERTYCEQRTDGVHSRQDCRPHR